MFKTIDLLDFPADECTIPLKINSNFFRSDKKRLVIIKDVDLNEIIIKNVYPCLGEKDGKDIFGFVGEPDLYFFNLENERFLIKGVSDPESLDNIIKSLVQTEEE